MEMVKPILYNQEKGMPERNYQLSATDPEVSFSAYTDKSNKKQQRQSGEVYSNCIELHHQITDIQWQKAQEINFSPKVVDTLSYINSSLYPVDKTFHFSWSTEVEQSTTWNQKCMESIGEDFEYEARLPNSKCTLKISYCHIQSTSTTSMLLTSSMSAKVTIAPRKMVIAQLILLVSETVELPFIATIKSVGVTENCNEQKMDGLWCGTLYKLSSTNINVCETEIGIM